MDRILLMRSFVEVARSESFADAGRSLGMSGSLVGRHVRELERQISTQLVVRTNQNVTLTETGERYATFARRILSEIDEEDAKLHDLRELPSGPLSIVCPKWIGSLDVGDALAAFVMKYPMINVRFEVGGMSERPHDFLDKGFDVAIATRQVRDSRVMIRKIADLQFLVIASPSYALKSGLPQSPDEVLRHDCLIHSNYPVWHIRDDARIHKLKVTHPVYVTNSYLTLYKAAAAGRGLAMVPRGSALADIRRHTLVEVLPALEVPTRSVYAIYSPGRYTLARVTVFLDFFVEWFREHPLLADRSETQDGEMSSSDTH